MSEPENTIPRIGRGMCKRGQRFVTIERQSGSTIFLCQSTYPDPTEPQQINIYVGNAEEGIEYASSVNLGVCKEELIALRDQLDLIIQNDMIV